MICVRLCDHIRSLAFKIKIAQGMKDFFQRFFIAKGTFRCLSEGSIYGKRHLVAMHHHGIFG